MGTLLESIHSPADVKSLSTQQMANLAEEIRAFLIQTLSKTGGHLGPNLGVVELTLALHAVFDSPDDKILFDVSHQAYVHKIVTGRLDRFATIRQPGGLNGFMLRTESEHDCYGAGHAGTALSGLVCPRRSFARQWNRTRGGPRRDCPLCSLVAGKLPARLDPNRRRDKPGRRHGIHMGALRGPQQGPAGQSRNHQWTLRFSLAQAAGWRMEDHTRCKRE